ncbi:hypothetical protein NDU88_003208 [Pleurodeles waltl]|uniref:Uncharacterized protein n=1 Tax=Pleurodeles waltl TaxID=8319 RepID=A0AAV7QB42_PLEWA|nr:hypothetical protein NDU88_003208 [Pleurodeles waltl]
MRDQTGECGLRPRWMTPRRISPKPIEVKQAHTDSVAGSAPFRPERMRLANRREDLQRSARRGAAGRGY